MGRRKHRKNTPQTAAEASAAVSPGDSPEVAAAEKKPEEEEKFFEYYAKDNRAFFGSIILALVIMGIAYFFIYICEGAHELYDEAPYKAEVEATLVKVDEYEKEKEVLDDYYKDLSPAERKKHTKTEHYTLYVLDWEYEVDGKTYHIEESDRYLSSAQVGDKRDYRVYSYDGVEYKKASDTAIADLLLGVSRIIFFLLAFFIVRVIIEKIRFIIRKKKTAK